MSKNIVIDGVTYSDVPSVRFKTTDGTYTSFGEANLQEVTKKYTSTGIKVISPASGYDGLSRVTVNISIPEYDGSVT